MTTTENAAARLLRCSIELLWRDQDPPTRGPKPGLSVAQIVTAAIEVADAHGVDALSMRCVARKLGVGTMTLYRYVPSKSVLLDLMLDKVSAPGPEAEQLTGAHWRTVLETVARGAYRLYLDHPWLLRVNWTRPVLGPNSLAGVELVIAALAGQGLTSQERVNTMVSIDSLATGIARSQVLYASAEEETGLSDDEFWKAQYPALEEAMATGDYPAMAALDDDAFDSSWDTTFEFSLQRLLDGLERLIESRQPHP